ncbi:MAG: peptide chain release factor 3 [Nitrospira sp.]|nr:peptide chain release factor 3 [Nitrospira sp.]MDD9859887.1 peptide chain release factor 3 [Nitrospira sp.]
MPSDDSHIQHDIQAQANRRRTFAIISHPDAGKTTVTEKLLLYSGMVRTAGMVGSRKSAKTAASDWMAMEQERGISITTSAMQFQYKHAVINVLDTPGHEDFCEDTYRTLTAADSAIMVIDAAKGVEPQTRKLFEVCRLRHIPVLTLINKMDLPGRPPLELTAEVEDVLRIHASPINWPVGSGQTFVGVVDRATQQISLFTKMAAGGAVKSSRSVVPLDSPDVRTLLGEALWQDVHHDLELLTVAGNPYTTEAFLNGDITPVFFASALTNFGIENFFDAFVEMAPAAMPRTADRPNGTEIVVDPTAWPFSAYVFKIQANMNPRHRDSTAFLRVCSGRFERDMVVTHHRLGTTVRLSRPHRLVAKDRDTVDVAYPGDIIGVVDPGQFAIGDTVSLSNGFNYKSLPQFPPEVFARIRPTDVGKRKAFDKALEQMTAEGTVQILRNLDDREFIIAAVGRLQFDVLQFRLRNEYRVESRLEPLPYECSAWLKGDLNVFRAPSDALIVKDQRDRPVVLFRSPWSKQFTRERHPDHELLDMG